MYAATTYAIKRIENQACRLGTSVLFVFLALLLASTVARAEQRTSVEKTTGFIENRGQLDARVRYYITGPLASIYFTDEAVVLDLKEPATEGNGARASGIVPERRILSRAERRNCIPADGNTLQRRACAVHLRFDNASTAPAIIAKGALAARYNFFLGNDPAGWRTHVRSYSEIIYENLWPGTHLVFRIEGGKLTYEAITAPGADPDRVRFSYEGAEGTDRASDGSILIKTALGDIVDSRPIAGARGGSLALLRESNDGEANAAADASPATAGGKAASALIWSSYLPGSGYDYAEDIALDSGGAPVVVGHTDSPVFPTSVGAYDPSYNGGADAFVAKLSADGSSLLWGTYIGSSSADFGVSVTLDSSNNVIVAGNTSSTGFPTTAGAWDQTHNGLDDVFVARLDPTGSTLQWSTFLGGSGYDDLNSGGTIDYIASGYTLVICGTTTSADFPATSGVYDRTINGETDLFVTRLAGAGNLVAWSTFIGGSEYDEAWDMELDATGNPVLTGKTDSTDFPTTAGAYDQTFNGGPGDFDGYVAKLNSTGTTLMWSTYLGGSNWEESCSVALDPAGNPVVTGYSSSADYPTSFFAYDRILDGDSDVTVTKLDAVGSTLIWSTYLGGGFQENGYDVVIGPTGNAIVTGVTASADFPTTPGAIQQIAFPADAFVSELNGNNGSTLLSSTLLGGSGWDAGKALELDGAGDVLIVGDTESPDFPTTAGAYATVFNFAMDVFVSKIDMSRPVAPWFDVTSPPVDDAGGGHGVAWADFDNDGDLDLYLANNGSANRLFRNDGGYNFVDVAAAAGVADAGAGFSVAWGDYNSDGDLDLYLVNHNQANKLYRNNGNSTFTDVTVAPLGDPGPGRGAAWGDYDSDSDLDLYLTNYGTSNRLLRNDGGGSFTDVTTGPVGDTGNGMGLAWGDYDNDRDLDIYLANHGQANKLLRNDGGGAFFDMTSFPLDDAGNGTGVAWGDFDNDGFLDLYLCNNGQANKLMQNAGGGGLFIDMTTPPLDDNGSGMGVALGDYDNDGDLDIYLANNGQANKLLDNVANLQFVDITGGPLGDTGAGIGVAMGDANNDADQDIYLANNGGANKLLRNNVVFGKSKQATNSWLHVQLQGTSSSRDGIGARIRIVAGGTVQIREVSGGSGYCSQNSLLAEFGLGAAGVVDTVQIRWPRGGIQTFLAVLPGKMTAIEEPTSVSQENDSPPAGKYALHGNYPNPFNPATEIRYTLPTDCRVKAEIFDIAGKRVATLADQLQTAGERSLCWDASGMASGIYFVRVQAGQTVGVRKLTLVK